MIYFLESPYINKLFKALSNHQSDLTLLPLNQIDRCTYEDVIILDEVDVEHLPKQFKKYKVLGEGQGKISKFQPYKDIAKALLNVTFPVLFVTSKYLTPELIHSVQILSQLLDFDYFIDCTLGTENSFSLYNYAMRPSCIPEKKKKYAVINHIKDSVNPPIDDICRFVTHLKQTGSTLIFSAPIKGPLDSCLINLSDVIVNLTHDGKHVLALSEITSKSFYTIPINNEVQNDKNMKQLILDMKNQWGGVLENL